MDQVKDAFQKVKNDIDSLRYELYALNDKLEITRQQIIEMCDIIKNLSEKMPKNTPADRPTDIPTHNEEIKTVPTYIPTDNSHYKPQKDQILGISTGNDGVPTDRQTDQQTDQHIEKTKEIIIKEEKTVDKQENTINNAARILESLDSLKKEIRLKFKRLTSQELKIFSILYQLDEEQGYSDYREIANKLKLTESSVRDYIGKLIKKGIPIEKEKINNKSIKLSISQNLKKVASLSTILQLIDI